MLIINISTLLGIHVSILYPRHHRVRNQPEWGQTSRWQDFCFYELRYAGKQMTREQWIAVSAQYSCTTLCKDCITVVVLIFQTQ